MEKSEIEKLIAKKSERLAFKIHKDKSEAWKCFVKVLVDDEGVDFVKCIDCSAIVKYVPGHGTGSMLSHIKSCKKMAAKKQQNTIVTMAGFLAEPRRHKRVLSAADKSDLTDCLAWMCAKDTRLVLRRCSYINDIINWFVRDTTIINN